jgi:tetratricopeptide (TPR) repeat protein
MVEETSVEAAGEDLVSCAVFLADKMRSAEARAVAMQNVIQRFLDKDDVDSAAEYADTIGDPFLRDRILIRVIAKCVAMNDDEYGLQLVDAIEEEGSRAAGLEAFALQKAAKGETDEAIRIAEDLEHSSEAFAGIAVNLAKAGESVRAEEALERIDFFRARVDAMIEIAAFHLKNGDKDRGVKMLERAFAVCDEIEFDEDRIRSYIEAGSRFVEAEKKDRAIAAFDEARKLAEQLDGIHKDNILANISVAFLQSGSVDLADRTLDLVADKTQLGFALAGFSRVYHEDGEEQESLDAAEEAYAILRSETEKQIRDSKARFQVYSSIAVQFARVGKFERAMEMAHEIPDPGLEKSTLVNIAQVCVLRSEDEHFRQAVNALEQESDRVAGFISASDAKSSLGLTEEAIALVDEAAEMLESVPQIISRSELQMEIAGRYHFYGAEGKSRDAATAGLNIVPEILGDGNRAIALCELSEIYDRAGFEVSEAEKEVLEGIVRKAMM